MGRVPFGYKGSNLGSIRDWVTVKAQEVIDSHHDAARQNPFLALDALEQLAGPPPEPCYIRPQELAEKRQLLHNARLLVTQPGAKRSDLKDPTVCSSSEPQVDVSNSHSDLKTFALSLDLEGPVTSE